MVAASAGSRWPPRLPGQPIFYPVMNEEYAREIAQRWNVPASGAGFVTRFAVQKEFMDRYAVHQVGGGHHTEHPNKIKLEGAAWEESGILPTSFKLSGHEWWVPPEELEELNDQTVGLIEVIGEYR